MADDFTARYGDLLAGCYDCVDRVVLNAFFPIGHNPGGFRSWWRRLHGSDDQLDDTYLMRMAGRFARRVKAWAAANGVPVIFCTAGERKHLIAELALGALRSERKVTEAFRTGAGVGWHEHDEEVFSGCERFFRPGYAANLVASWLPALDGVEAKLRSGARVADIGCGHGASTALMARAYPNSSFTGSDYHQESIVQARKQIAEAGLGDQVTFDVASAQTFTGGPYDLVTSFDCLHDMGDPAGAARHIRQMLAPDGAWMVVEPYAGNSVTDNLNPVGRVYYSFSTFLCVPNALSQDGGYSLGAQAGEESIRRLTADAGYTRFRRVTETPFNIVYEARP